MKNKHIILGALLFLGSFASAQVNTQSAVSPTINTENPFLDASGYTGSFPNNQAKGLYFPKTDLTTWEFKTSSINPGKFKTYFDGMIVYNSGTGNTIADATKGGKQVAVTPGFYYFKNPNQSAPRGSVANGEWVRLGADASAFDGEWVYDDTTKRINLKRSGSGDFKNKVYYDERGGLISVDADKYPVFSLTENRNVDIPIRNLGFDKTLKFSKNLDRFSNTAGTAHFKQLGDRVMVIDAEEPTSNTRFYGGGVSMVTTPEDTKTHDQVYANQSSVHLAGKGSVNHVIGNSASSQVINSEIKGYIASTVSDTYLYTPKSIGASYGVQTRSFLHGSGNINQLVGTYSLLQSQSGSSSNVQNAIGHDVSTYFAQSSGTNIETLYGIRYTGINSLGTNGVVNNTSKVKTAYGLSIGDVRGASEANYAIYTHSGNVRIGDLADGGATTDRTVVVDKNGVLKVGTASGTTATKVGTTTGVECKEDNRGTMNFGRITINGRATDAIGFCMKNGDNEFRWYYIYGGAAHTVGTSAVFGSGL